MTWSDMEVTWNDLVLSSLWIVESELDFLTVGSLFSVGFCSTAIHYMGITLSDVMGGSTMKNNQQQLL
jgi:hypothetical protein